MGNIHDLNIFDLVEMGFEQRASDVMLKEGAPPTMRQHSLVKQLNPDLTQALTSDDVARLLADVMSDKQRRKFEDTMEMDLAFSVKGKCRVRCNVYMQRGTWATVMRIIPLDILTLEELGLPPVMAELTKHRLGLLLITGPTGCGKTTTIAAMLDMINQQRQCHIVTIEDPLEFVHVDKQAYVSQREVNIDTEDFQPALRAVVREAPDVILIGEMRDPETMHVAMQAGETGHLVFSTVHTASAYESMDRIINMFPPHEKIHLCQRLAGALRAIVSQKLVPRADGNGRVVASEILVCTPTVQKAIEDGHFSDLYHMMNEGQFWGMQTMNQSLLRYVKAGVITEQMAMNYAGIASELKQMLRR
ncbi:MAG TPA: PilT/PilU family type 4a pilus ATPase [Fimbriimonadaceae bacterium]|nr:PilT/PilU family type 4a pilus ATPase [Fimbriimonadaceae bacterium]